MIKPAAYSERREDSKVICHLCPADCRLTVGKRGICRSRFNRGGELVTDNYGELVTLAMDPIEKKPLYHFYPGTDILSTGPNSCNLGCVHCQNWTISQRQAGTFYCPPEKLVEAALSHESIGVAFTYTEPITWFEYIMDAAPLLRRAGLQTVLVSNGYISPEPLEELIRVIDAINVDLKSIRPGFYKRICKGRLEPVQHTIQRLAGSDVHLEVTNLIIPGLNDTNEDLADLIAFVADLSDGIALHFSAYRPDFKADFPSTPLDTMVRARTLALRRLKYVYLGNVWLEGSSDTHCPECQAMLVKRSGYQTSVLKLRDGRCLDCGSETGIIQ